MLVNSLPFLLFFIMVMIVYFLLPGSFQWIWLLMGSLFYYWMNDTPAGLVIFLIIVLINYLATMFMGEDQSNRKAVYTAVLIFDVLAIVLFKYSDFFADIIKNIMIACKSTSDFTALNKFTATMEEYAPMGISYFDLILIGYVTDVYWCKVTPLKNPGKAILFASFFPQMLSGPIVRYEEMESGLFGEKNRFSYENLVRGGERLLWGLFKKMVMAERFAVIVSSVYSAYEVYKGFYVWVAAAMFALQLYFDFSGLMDIVLGFAEILNIHLPENFDTPFYSTSLSEFWRRWHITLGGFLRDYILYPLQRSKFFRNLRKFCKSKLGKGYEKKWNLPLHLSLLVSWFLIGLWHGGGWNYIFGVGLYMWAVIVIGELLTPVFDFLKKIMHINTECESYKLFQRIRTFFLFIIGLSFFRAESLEAGFKMWKNAFSQFNIWIFFDKSLYELGIDRAEWGILILGLIMLFIVSYISQKEDFRDFINRQNFVFRIIVFGALFTMIICWGYYGMNFNAADFIYGRF